MNEKPNWSLIDKCGVWPVLGVTECNDCPSLINCWGTESQLPEPMLSPDKDGRGENTMTKSGDKFLEELADKALKAERLAKLTEALLRNEPDSLQEWVEQEKN